MPTVRAASPAVGRLAFAARRAGARAGILIALAVTVAAGVGLGSGLAAGGPLATSDVIAATLPGADAPEGWLQIQTRPAADPAAQRAAGAEVIRDIVGDDAIIEEASVGEAGTDFERVAWRLHPAATALTPEGVDRLSRALPRVLPAVRSSDAAEGGAIATGGLVEAVDAVAAAARTTSAISPMPIALFAVLAWFAVLQLARLLGTFRVREADLLGARGLSVGQSAILAAAEGAVVAALGAVVGAAAAGVGLAALWPGEGLASLGGLWPVIVLAAAVAASTVALAQSAAARSGRAASTGRGVRAASLPLAVLLIAAAAVLIWQAATTTATGWDAWTVAVTILAPTVGTAALAVIALVLFGPISALAASAAARSRGVAPVYPARQVARRTAAFSVAVALVVISMAGAVLAGSYAATWTGATARAADLAAGAPVRGPLHPVVPADARAAATVADAVAPVYLAPVVAGDVSARLIALPAESIVPVVTGLPDLAAEVGEALESAADEALAPIALPGATTGLRLTGAVTASGDEIAEAVVVTAHVIGDAGTPADVRLSVAASDGRFEAEGALPDGDGPWALVSIDAARGNAFPYESVLLTNMDVSALEGEAATTLDAEPIRSASMHPPQGFDGAVTSVVVVSSAGARPARVPVVVTDAFAASLDLRTGDDLDLRVDGGGRQFATTVAAVVPALPGIGAGAGVFADLGALGVGAAPTASGAATAPVPPLACELWASGGDGAALADVLGADVAAPDAPAATAAGGLASLWSIAALGGAVLAGVALVALLWAAARHRAGEVLVLRALGVAPSAQARLRSAETVFVVSVAGLLGIAGGVALSMLLLPPLVARTIPAAIGIPAWGLDPVPVALAAGILLVAFAVATAGASATIRRQGRSTRVEEAAP